MEMDRWTRTAQRDRVYFQKLKDIYSEESESEDIYRIRWWDGALLYRYSSCMQPYSALGTWTLFYEKSHWIYIVVILLSFLSWKGWNEKEENKTPISAKLGSMINGYEAGDSTKGRICIGCFVFLYTAIVSRLLIDNDACASLQTFMMDDVSICLSLSLYFFFGHHAEFINCSQSFPISQKFSCPIQFLC